MNSSSEIYCNLSELLASSGEYVTTVCGVSMWPMLRYRKDPILIHKAGQLKKYDVAVYSKTGKYVVHRVLDIMEDCYVIRGDNCLAKEYIPKQDVIGVVAGFWRFGKFIAVSNKLYRLYSRVWVAANPLIHLSRFAQSKYRAALRRLKGIRPKP